jgi:hypothetical protein
MFGDKLPIDSTNKSGLMSDFFHFGLRHSHRSRPIEEYMSSLKIKHRDLKKIHDKNLLLVGGGQSDIAGGLVRVVGAKPKSIINVDPYVKSYFNDQETVCEDYLEYNIAPDTFNEIWALYSLPAYVEKLSHVKTFYAKSLLGLAPRGTLRVFPQNVALSSLARNYIHEKGFVVDPEYIKGYELEIEGNEFIYDLKGRFPNVRVKDGWYNEYASGTRYLNVTVPEDKRKINSWVEKFL